MVLEKYQQVLMVPGSEP